MVHFVGAGSGAVDLITVRGARLLGELALDTKAYVARIRFGSETDTDDAEGTVVLSGIKFDKAGEYVINLGEVIGNRYDNLVLRQIRSRGLLPSLRRIAGQLRIQ